MIIETTKTIKIINNEAKEMIVVSESIKDLVKEMSVKKFDAVVNSSTGEMVEIDELGRVMGILSMLSAPIIYLEEL